jgi:CyaY protein
MADLSFLQHAERELDRLEAAIERTADAAGEDLEVSRTGNVIEVEFDDGSKLIINSHEAAGEIWVAARSGGFHFRPDAAGGWTDSRNGRSLATTLTELLTAQAGRPLSID